MLDRAALDQLIERGEVDTVILAFPDQQGRLLGKRLTGRHFREHVAQGGQGGQGGQGDEGGVHACNYLLTVDMEMEPLPGYRLAAWEQGYGDFLLVPDWATARRLPWLEGTALLLGDVHYGAAAGGSGDGGSGSLESGGPGGAGGRVEEAPRQVLRRQVERAGRLGLRVRLASELECYLYRGTFAEAAAGDYRDLPRYGNYLEDYHILQGTREEPVLRRIRNEMGAAGVPMEGTKGEWGRGQTELNLEYADALEMADRHTLLKHGAKEIAEQAGACVTFMAKPSADEAGSSCHIHTSVWDPAGERNLFWEDGPSRLFEHFLAGQLALARELALFYAPTPRPTHYAVSRR